ncbi:MAG TPA: anaerobic ribonucleoside triphosphate reductase [Clostridiaceae bacterium]|nr:anaerobic ribonucleoside triphosphate reductase [Clostridiaceae bacterium]
MSQQNEDNIIGQAEESGVVPVFVIPEIDVHKEDALGTLRPLDGPKLIIKRDGSPMPFDAYKIRNAIAKANAMIPSETMSEQELDEVTVMVVRSLPADGQPGVEHIQDRVEEALFQAGRLQTAKAYMIYRAEHTKIREAQDDLMKLYREVTFARSEEKDLLRENANIDADSAMGTMLKYGSEGAKAFVDQEILPTDMAVAHREGDIHIHDKDFYMLTETCCQIDITKLFADGFSTGHGYLRQPQSITSYSALACIAIQANQNEMHGGQSIPAFDYAMAPGVNKTWKKTWQSILTTFFLSTQQDQSYEGAQEMSNDLLDSFALPLVLDNERELKLHLASEIDKVHIEQLAEQVITVTKRETYQAMQALVHNLNTMNSRAGAQVPFSSINYGTDTSAGGRLVISALLDATMDGLGNGETPIFPVQIFKVKEGVNYQPTDPNYDLFQKAMLTSAKRLFPNFSFLDAPFNKQFLRENDPNSEVAYMGCRTRVIANVYDPTRSVTNGRGNLSFTSINLPRLGIEARGNLEVFFRQLDKKMDLVFRQLLHRYRIQAARRVRNYPFLMGQGVWLDSEKLNPEDTIDQVLRHGTLSVGFIGLAETLKALTGKHHGESEASRKLGLEIVKHMRRRCDEKAKLMNMNFTLLATPAEGLSGRFLNLDRKRYGVLPGITDHDFYTNSFHIPVYFPISALDKIRIEGPYHELTNAGHISYVELDGDAAQNQEAFAAIIRAMKENNVGYGSVNHPVDRDPICGYVGVINDICPRCGRRENEILSQEKLQELQRQYPNLPTLNYQARSWQDMKFQRIRRITGYLVGSLDRFNDAKQKEVALRVRHGIEQIK